MAHRKRARVSIRVSREADSARVYAASEGRDVSRAYLLPQRLQFGPGATLRMAGIGGVGTAPDLRGQGLARRVLARVMREVRRDGYACSGLFTGTSSVAHRLYREHSYADVMVYRPVVKLLDPEGFVAATLAGWAERDPLVGWQGVVRVSLHGHQPVDLRLCLGRVVMCSRAPREVALSLTASAATFGELSRGAVTVEYALAAKQLAWEGCQDAFERLRKALQTDHPNVRGF
jgi:GNAT superfamily N-acetyltransferase